MEKEDGTRLSKMIEQGIKVCGAVPNGFYRTEGACNAPNGYKWYNNKKSRFSDGYEQILVVDD